MEAIKSRLEAEDVFPALDFPLAVLPRSPQIPYPPHTHGFTELVVVLAGLGTHETEGEVYTVEPGDVFVIQGNRSHGYRDVKGLRLVNIVFEPRKLDLPLRDLAALPGYQALFHVEPTFRSRHHFGSRLRLDRGKLHRVTALARQLEQELLKTEEGYRFMARALFMELLGLLARSAAVSGGDQRRRQVLKIAGILSWMENHLDRSIQLEDLRRLTGLSDSSLLRAFRLSTGHPPLEYHLRLRIRRAAELLRTTNRAITFIAFETGFRDSNYFSRQFRRVMGLSPRTYRRET